MDERRCVNSVTAPVAFEDACVSSDGAVVMSIGEPMSSDMGPKLDIRMKQLKDKLCREKEKALKRNNYKVTLRECSQRKAGADVVVQTKQSKHVGKRSKRCHQNAVLPESV